MGPVAMALSREMQMAVHRGVLFGLGGLAGIALWALGENWNSPALPPAAYLALLSFVSVYCGVALALAGPVATSRALGGALLSALPVTALVGLAGRRFAIATDLLDDPVMLAVVAILVLFSTPFLSVWLQDRRQWLQYGALFDAVWTMTARYIIAWIFVAVFWLVALLSDALLQLVDINVIDRIISTNWARFGLTGAVLGLALAVVHEYRNILSPYPILRLVRLLVPAVLAVVAVFLAAVPFRGLTQLFGEFSAAGPLMGAAIAAITLISTALDRSDDQAIATRGIRAATRILALLLPLLAGLAVWAVALRVGQYGWTPDRVLAGIVSLFLLVYGLGYGGAVLARAGWAGRIRTVNVAMALTVIAVAILWMTPVLNVYRISTASQISRFISGDITIGQLALWQMAHDWGRAGQAGIETLAALGEGPDGAELASRIAVVKSQPTQYQFEREIERGTAPDRAARLANLLAVRPQGVTLTADMFTDLPSFRLDQWLQGCQRGLADGRPGCVLIRGRFLPVAANGLQGMVLYLDADGRARVNYLRLRDGGAPVVRDAYDPVADQWPTLPGNAIAEALDGRFEVRPSGGEALHLGGAVLVPEN
jgi:hypothetical protein